MAKPVVRCGALIAIALDHSWPSLGTIRYPRPRCKQIPKFFRIVSGSPVSGQIIPRLCLAYGYNVVHCGQMSETELTRKGGTMSKTKHTPGPWEADTEITDFEGERYFSITNEDMEARHCGPLVLVLANEIPEAEALANARRIVTCVNACAGIPSNRVPELIKDLCR